MHLYHCNSTILFNWEEYFQCRWPGTGRCVTGFLMKLLIIWIGTLVLDIQEIPRLKHGWTITSILCLASQHWCASVGEHALPSSKTLLKLFGRLTNKTRKAPAMEMESASWNYQMSASLDIRGKVRILNPVAKVAVNSSKPASLS